MIRLLLCGDKSRTKVNGVGSLTGSDDAQYSEAKFLQVRRIIDRFQGREAYADLDRRWTAKVTDVRNWFVFAASERWREDDSEHEHYADSGGKSGGQKEKLAYTVLAASLAYQFGLEWGAVRSRSFRFVVIDEAFGRGSDESAQYGNSSPSSTCNCSSLHRCRKSTSSNPSSPASALSTIRRVDARCYATSPSKSIALKKRRHWNELDSHLRLKQERIGFEWLVGALGRV